MMNVVLNQILSLGNQRYKFNIKHIVKKHQNTILQFESIIDSVDTFLSSSDCLGDDFVWGF